ncbi:DgyrCDS6010 [Dimorphilus gyrociliatus]|uniref:DgyrCDS6010 n=1 Tax=Dimorphilus gyrociliatus TaxID=2664684 RepID=A0A7I8VLP8_9ANNE|nr:DgyrCDS6010 [Dimorphilus gyrociliatus]
MEFSNPVAPLLSCKESEEVAPKTNEDFRKLLMTPRVGGNKASQHLGSGTQQTVQSEKSKNADAASERRKKKQFYAKMKREEDEKQKELESRYRDRAKERRDGLNKDYIETELISTTANYRAVAPNAKMENLADRRKQLIEESKYLGGDMEHTHLVKGLDFALLDKVRTEIFSKEQQEIDEKSMEQAIERETIEDDKVNTMMGKAVMKYILKPQWPLKNELFAPGRMAYQIELDDEEETDVPTTMIRSKSDCPEVNVSTGSQNTNDVVINKLTQIISYLRTGKHNKKIKKAPLTNIKSEHELTNDLNNTVKKEHRKRRSEDVSIYDNVDDYVPSYERRERRDDRKERRDKKDYERDRKKDDREKHNDRHKEHKKERKSYFEKPNTEDNEVELLRKEAERSTKELVRAVNEKYDKGWNPSGLSEVPKSTVSKKSVKGSKVSKVEPDSYAECYPGMVEMVDAAGDSDDEVDYLKMDKGNKKGPVGRWDFENQEEYSDYMSQREALPKAAFQYGKKMQDGRRTRRQAPKDERKELDREWQKIQNIISKRKTDLSFSDNSKKVKY